jgi:hypothetical protein
MPQALEVPAASAGPEAAADWLELAALRAEDRNSSLQELIQAVRTSGSLDAVESADAGGVDARGESSERVAEDAFSELGDRLTSCDSAYPFDISSGYVRVTAQPKNYVYLFLLLLSKFGLGAGPAKIDAPKLFEEICADAARSYLGGQALGVERYLFGAPRRGTAASFRKAVNDLCLKLGEGGGCRERMRLKHQKDAKLDLVAWRAFHDGRASKLVAFGQCATGRNWHTKLTELQPTAFCGLWFRDSLAVQPLRFFFVPFRVDRSTWEEAAFYGGVLFDRCRIAANAKDIEQGIADACRNWSEFAIRKRLA